MKKTYITPSTENEEMMCDTILVGSLNDGNDLQMMINQTEATKEAGSRGSFWDDAE